MEFNMHVLHTDFNILSTRDSFHDGYIQKILYYVIEKHGAQINRKSGELYVDHLIRVANCFPWSKDLQAISLLHDVLEDTDATRMELYDRFSVAIADAVDTLTRAEGQSWNDYIRQVKQNGFATYVKCADLIDNMNLTRLRVVTLEDAKRQKKYAEALEKLMKDGI